MDANESQSTISGEADRLGGLTRKLTGVIGWFASSLGFIGAFFYAYGYLIGAAQLKLLGVGRLVKYGHDDYVQAGGRSLADIVSMIATIAEPFSVILIVLMLLAFAAAPMARRIMACSERWAGRIKGIWPGAAYAVLLFILLYKYGDPQAFADPLRLSNILFTAPPPGDRSLTSLYNQLMAGDRKVLGGIFETELMTFIVTGLLFLGCHYLTVDWRWRPVARAPFAILFALYTLLLPMLYGVLKSQVEFPIVVISPAGTDRPAPTDVSFLLQLDEHNAVLYLAPEQKAVWRRLEHIEKIEVIGMAPILRLAFERKAAP